MALVRALAERSRELGLVLHVAHLHHGLRGAEADADRDFCRKMAENLGLPFHESRVDTAAEAQADPAKGKSSETIEEAARRLRYGWFRELMGSGVVDAVATAHTRDDQAETVLARFLRGAWTEGLAGIHPVVRFPEGPILRPLLATSRTEIEAWLRRLGQEWREDSSNRHLTFTRNRIRHELLPLLEGGIPGCGSTWRRWRNWPGKRRPGGKPKWPVSPPSSCFPDDRCEAGVGRPERGWPSRSPGWPSCRFRSSAGFFAMRRGGWARRRISRELKLAESRLGGRAGQNATWPGLRGSGPHRELRLSGVQVLPEGRGRREPCIWSGFPER